MAEQVILPRQGQSVETCLILNWKKQEGDPVAQGEVPDKWRGDLFQSIF